MSPVYLEEGGNDTLTGFIRERHINDERQFAYVNTSRRNVGADEESDI